MHRFIPVLAKSKGFKIEEIPVKHTKRKYGKSKYGVDRFLKGAFDLFSIYFLITYQSRPLHFFGKIGLFLISLSSAALIHLGLLWIKGIPIGGRPLLLISIFILIFGLQIILFGFSSEMQFSLFKENRRNQKIYPKYIKNYKNLKKDI